MNEKNLREQLEIDTKLKLLKEHKCCAESILCIETYMYCIELESQQLKEQLKQRDEVIDEARKEIKNIQEHYHELIMKDYKQEDSVFVNKCCKTGFILNVKSYFDLIELILNKYKGDNNE